MKAILKNLITLKTRWVPNNPVDSFLPFLIHLVRSKKLYVVQIEKLADEFEAYYGFNLTYFVIRNILNYLSRRDICEYKNNQYYFVIRKLKALDTINEKDFDQYNDDVDSLISDFLTYCNDDSLSRNNAEEVIVSFIKEYDSDLLFTNKGLINDDDNPALKMFWIEYLKEKMRLNNGEYKTVLKMCEGNIIRSLLFDEVDSKQIYSGVKVFIDTPLIFRILGYYGDFLKKEYEFLFNAWRKQGGSFYIYEHNLDECLNVLRIAEEWVEAKEIDPGKTSDVCIYFREKGYAKEDVALEIETFEKKLKEIGIQKQVMDFNTDSGYMEDSKQIREMILRQYNKRVTFDSVEQSTTMIETDVKSILYSFFLRENNSIHTMREAKLIYLTSNSALHIVSNNYQKSKYGQSISPVQLDAFIGMVICLNDIDNIPTVVENRVISHCYSAYKPTRALKEAYGEKLVNMLTQKKVSNDDYYLLKHHSIITDELVKGTCGIADNLNDETIYDFLDKVKIRLVQEEKEAANRRLVERDNEHKINLSKLEIEKEEEIKRKEDDYTSLKDRNEKIYQSKVTESYGRFITKVKLAYFIVLSLVCLTLTYYSIQGLIKNNVQPVLIISNIIMVLFTFGQILFYSIRVSKLFEKWFVFQKRNYEKLYRDFIE